MKKLRITVSGKAYDVVVETLASDTTPATPPAPVAAPAAVKQASVVAPAPTPVPKAVGAAGTVLCPIGGKLVSIDVKVGSVVEEGAQLATVEAMKMNTYIFSPQAGTVSEILAQPGEGVEEGAVILRLS